MPHNIGILELLQQLPVDRLDASTREMLEHARTQDNGSAIKAAVRQAAGELLQRGELIRMAVEGGSALKGPVFLVRGTSQLLDLTSLSAGNPRLEARPTMVTEELENEVAKPRVQRMYPEGLASVLEAMERAQDLAVGDPRAGEPTVVIDRILSLLHSYVHDIHLHAQLNSDLVPKDEAHSLLSPPEVGHMPFWLRNRRPGQSFWIPNSNELPEELVQRLPGNAISEPRVTAVVPLRAPGQADEEAGMLYVSAKDDWSPEDLMGLAHRLSSFVTRRWRCQRDVNRRVLTDSLTSIPNRAFFDSQFPLELERARRGGFPLTLVIGDLDHFKNINDTHGHQCGDLVLQGVARQLQTTLRRIDHVCRIGGEEFAFILPYTNLDEAREVLARVAGRFFRITLPPEQGVGVISVTMSYGAVTFPEAGNSTGELHRKADSMLYQAKELGRNRCCLWIDNGRHQQLRPASPNSEI